MVEVLVMVLLEFTLLIFVTAVGLGDVAAQFMTTILAVLVRVVSPRAVKVYVVLEDGKTILDPCNRVNPMPLSIVTVSALT